MFTPTIHQHRAAAEMERRRRQRQNKGRAADPGNAGVAIGHVPAKKTKLVDYRFAAVAYVEDKLGWTPWSGTAERPGQVQVIEAYELALKQLHERDAWEKGELATEALQWWRPGQIIKNYISVDAGHTVGKTKLGAGLISHFFDTCTPAIVYTYAPSFDQINDLLWKEIRTDRRSNKSLPGRVLETPELKFKANHFAKGRATNDARGQGTERTQGQHGRYLMFVLDEAEGIPKFVWDAVESMASGGIVIVLILRNPRTRTSQAHKIREKPYCAAFRISCLWAPNVLADREKVPGSVRRDYVEKMLATCEVIDQHNPDFHTFELDWRPGVIYKPSIEVLWRVLGIAAAHNADNTFCPVGRYEAAVNRPPYEKDDPTIARIGIDAARYGNDFGTLYVRHIGKIQRKRQFYHQDGYQYYLAAKEEAKALAAAGVKDIGFRVDGGGGYGSTVIDNLNHDLELQELFEKFSVVEVHNNGVPYDKESFYDTVTEMYYHAGEALKVLALIDPPETLAADICERTFKYGKKDGVDVKVLVPKERFKELFGRSPDDGDGLCLAAAPDYIFGLGSLVLW